MNHGSGRLIDLSRLITQKLVTSCNAEVAEKRSPNMKIKLNDMEYYSQMCIAHISAMLLFYCRSFSISIIFYLNYKPSIGCTHGAANSPLPRLRPDRLSVSW